MASIQVTFWMEVYQRNNIGNIFHEIGRQISVLLIFKYLLE